MRNKFIELLEDQPNQNFGNRKTKINIHFPIRGKMLNYCINLNSDIQKITQSGVSFMPNSFQIPHITLYMGFISSENDYNIVMKKIHELSKELEKFEIIPSKPYVKEPKSNYLFIDTNQSEKIINLKKIIKSKLEGHIEPLTWDVVNETPHITFGHIKNKSKEVIEFLEKKNAGPAFFADAIEISFSGSWGSCIGTIRTFEMEK